MFKKTILVLIKTYQKFFSPDSGIFSFWSKNKICRFYPSCSQYALESVERHGAGKGLFLALKRLLRCHPLNPGGYDPVK